MIPDVLEVLYCFVVLDCENKLAVRSGSASTELDFEELAAKHQVEHAVCSLTFAINAHPHLL